MVRVSNTDMVKYSHKRQEIIVRDGSTVKISVVPFRTSRYFFLPFY